MPDKIMFFKEKNYKLHFPVGITSNVLSPAVSVFDTGIGLNLIQTSFLPPAWWLKIKLVTDICHRSASNDNIPACGAILLFVCLRDLRVPVRFGLIENQEVPILIGTLYKDRLIKGIFLKERIIVPIHYGPVPMLVT